MFDGRMYNFTSSMLMKTLHGLSDPAAPHSSILIVVLCVAAFVSTVAYLEEYRSSNCPFHLLPVGAVTVHPTKGTLLGYYSDIVVHRDVK